MSATEGGRAALFPTIPEDFDLLIARLIADPATVGRVIDAVRAELAQHGWPVAMAEPVASGSEVIELQLPEGDPTRVRAIIERHCAPCDLLVTTREPVVPHVFVSDMDSTMISAECIDELADFAGIKAQIAAITERAMLGELDFEAALRERVGLLEGLDLGAIDACLATRIAPMPGARVLVQTLKALGCRTVLVTGGFHHFADPVAADLGFDHVVANRLDVGEGKLTGRLAGAITDSAVKRATLLAETAAAGEGAISLATGDGANDIPMLEAATYGIAYRAKPRAREAANGSIDRGDLTSVLELLGVPRENWVWE
jgi:phosphoserine phosphatase